LSLDDQGPSDIDRIDKEERDEVFEELTRRRSFFHLRVLGRDYQRLTCITGLERRGSKGYLLVDCPEGLPETNRSLVGATVRIDFMGADKLQYAFKTAVVKISERDLWLEYPEFVERLQRRGYYRIVPPTGTMIVLRFQDQVHEADVLNLSVGGSLLRVSGAHHGDTGLKVGDSLAV